MCAENAQPAKTFLTRTAEFRCPLNVLLRTYYRTESIPQYVVVTDQYAHKVGDKCLRGHSVYYVTLIAINDAALLLDTLQSSQDDVNCVVRTYLSLTPVAVGVRTSLIGAVYQTLPF